MANHLLTAAGIKSLPLSPDGKKCMHGDGGGLSVLVEPTKDGVTRSYNFRFTFAGARQIMRLGTIDELTLSEARAKTLKYRLMIRDGKDPRQVIAGTAAGQMTLKQYADKFWNDLTKGKPTDPMWRRSLAMFAALHDKPIATISLGEVYATVKPFWATHPVSASRRLAKVHGIFRHAVVSGLRADNPCELENLQVLGLEAARKVAPVKSHNALPYAELPAFFHKLSYQPEITARAVEFAILTGTRSQETREARWSWLSDDLATITIPAEYMKGGKAHVVPLATQVIDLLKALPRTGERIFPSPHQYDVDKVMAPQTLLNMVNRVLCLEGKPATETVKLHGFRSTFRDYGADKLDVASEVLEFCLAHRKGDAVERAYWRSDMLDKRRAVMQAWADYATSKAAPANVVKFKKEVA